jgi:hypothetical protein
VSYAQYLRAIVLNQRIGNPAQFPIDSPATLGASAEKLAPTGRFLELDFPLLHLELDWHNPKEKKQPPKPIFAGRQISEHHATHHAQPRKKST